MKYPAKSRPYLLYNSVPKQEMQLKCLAFPSIPLQWPVHYSKASHTALMSKLQCETFCSKRTEIKPFVYCFHKRLSTSICTCTHTHTVPQWQNTVLCDRIEPFFFCTDMIRKMVTVHQEQVRKPPHETKTDTQNLNVFRYPLKDKE